MTTHKSGPGPAGSERTIYALWEHIERVREQSGEAVAQQLARRALKAVTKPQKDKQP